MQGVSSIGGTLFFMPCKSVEERWKNEVEQTQRVAGSPVRAPHGSFRRGAQTGKKEVEKNKNF